MTLTAVLRGVRSQKRIPGLSVIEGVPTGLAPPDQFKGLAVMLDVTRPAVPVVGPGVQTAARGDPFTQQLVTGQAAIGIDPALRVVAVEAPAAAIEP
jgi:hypothetical protein